MNRLFIIFFLGLSVLSPVLALAQNLETSPIKLENLINNLPQPISDFIHTFQKINLNFQIPSFLKGWGTKLENAVLQGKNSSFTSEGILSKLKEIFFKINDWFRRNLGVGLTDILKALANLIIWILESLIKFVKLGLSFL